ncbi:MAG: phospholipase D family protein [bacterium]
MESVTKTTLFIVITLLMLGGCAGLPENYTKTHSVAFNQPESTFLGRFFDEHGDQNPGKSGFAPMQNSRHAFTTRIGMTEMAQRSLDLQYYIWKGDTTGRVLVQRVVQAADRGVKVRILIDDINNTGRDAAVAALDAHPNIEIRVFNPFASRGFRGLEMIADFGRINHRMHNKIMIADNALAVVGGRNIGDHYFGVGTDSNFRDLDVAAVGPIVKDISSTFDYFWNSDWAVPISVITSKPATEKQLREVVIGLDQKIAEAEYPFPLDADVNLLRSEFKTIRDEFFVWARGGVVWDNPDDINDVGANDIVQALKQKAGHIDRELLIESAYFVPAGDGVANAREMVERGVRVRVLTNSMASNDVLPAHAGYAKYRKPLLEAGVELYELRPDSGYLRKNWIGESKSALHTKAMVFDRESAFIGSFNLDPRSAVINTEIGIYIESPEFAQKIVDYLDEGVQPAISYRLSLEDGDLRWDGQKDGQPVNYNTDPDTSLFARFLSGLIGLLPIESQL